MLEGWVVHCVVEFPATWISGDRFESALQGSSGPLAPRTLQVTFRFPVGCKIMVDGAIRLLSLANQLVSSNRRVRLQSEEGTMG